MTCSRAIAVLVFSLVFPFAAIAGDPAALTFRQLYDDRGDLSELVVSLDGDEVALRGFMAPPLKADADWFVLTKLPMAVCPFCSTDADWPRDIILVKVGEAYRAVPYTQLVEVTGTLKTGVERDSDTGFVSLIRIEDADFRVAR